ncbi:MAG: prolyl oligopeptidase family serine peptidase [bacterium]
MKSKRCISLLLFIAMISISNIFAQENEWETVTLSKTPNILEPEITFLQEKPIIDGVLDKSLENLPIRMFETIWKIKKDSLVKVNYKLAYGTGFFYVYIEAEAEKLTFRDRAYQNGDGFILLIAKPQPNNEPTDEFYELACSAVNDPSQEVYRHIFWNYNVNQLFVLTSNETKLEFKEKNGKISFELLLPWNDVRPYHPWISEGIGFNLTFCKAVEPNGQIWFTMVGEDNVGREFTKHNYTTLKFQNPVVKGTLQTFVSFDKGHITKNDSLNAVLITVSDKKNTENLSVYIKKDNEDSLLLRKVEYSVEPGITKHKYAIATSKLTEGNYNLSCSIQNNTLSGSTNLSILHNFDIVALTRRLDELKNKLSKGSYTSIKFLLQDTQKRLEQLKPYETSGRAGFILNELINIFEAAEKGVDLLVSKTGFSLKAYLSKIDTTLQPYTVYLPNDFDKNKIYPLMVFLHGSASDEGNIRGFLSIIPDGFIAVGPLGRGKSNAYSRDHAQDDIAEVINAVEEDYLIDSTKILLTGFSMGGYGVYRTFYETPAKFSALAIFSGGPSMGSKYAPNEISPDFRDEKNLTAFKNIPIFIFHGEKDLNVSLPLTKELAEKLKNAGAKVNLQIEPNKGHERPGKEIIDNYKKWVKEVMKLN